MAAASIPDAVRHQIGLYSMRDRTLSLPGGRYSVSIETGERHGHPFDMVVLG